MTTTTEPAALVLDADAIGRLPARPFDATQAVTNTILWQDGVSMAGLLTIPASRNLGAHAHHANHHHIWVVRGHAHIAGSALGPGGYAHIPAGVAHDIDASETEGCTVYYLYIRQA